MRNEAVRYVLFVPDGQRIPVGNIDATDIWNVTGQIRQRRWSPLRNKSFATAALHFGVPLAVIVEGRVGAPVNIEGGRQNRSRRGGDSDRQQADGLSVRICPEDFSLQWACRSAAFSGACSCAYSVSR